MRTYSKEMLESAMSTTLDNKSEYFTPWSSVYSKQGWQLLERSANLATRTGYIGVGDDGGSNCRGSDVNCVPSPSRPDTGFTMSMPGADEGAGGE